MHEFDFVDYFIDWPWWLPLLVLVGSAAVFNFFTYFFYKITYKKFDREGKNWQALLVKTLHYPMRMFVWFCAFSMIVSLYAHHIFDFGVITTLLNFIRVGLVIALAWGLYIFIMKSQEIYLRKRGADKTTVSMLSKLSIILIVLLTLLMVLPIFGIEIAGILALGGFSGIIVGFAARDTISNLLGGFILAIDKPFLIGDWVYTVDGKVEGVVEAIGWRLTVIRNFAKQLIYMPNAEVISTTFVNGSRMSNRRIQETVTVRYEDDQKVPEIVERLNDYIKNHEDLDQNQLNFAALVKFGPSSLDILFRAYTKTVSKAEYHVVLQRVLLDALEIVRTCGGDLAFPTTTVDLKTTETSK